MQRELFDDPSGEVLPGAPPQSGPVNPASPAEQEDPAELLERLGELSPNAGDDALYALLSGMVPRKEIFRFARKIIEAAEAARRRDGAEAERAEAERVRTDRLDPGTETIRRAAWKTAREYDRLRGLLRFKPEPPPDETPEHPPDGRKFPASTPWYTARCSPDHFVLPLLADHFFRRFGETPWRIIDEKRRLALVRKRNRPPELRPWQPEAERPGTERTACDGKDPDPWEARWKNYHRAINNESRANPALQKQFMPERYWKYLPEMETKPPASQNNSSDVDSSMAIKTSV